MEPSPGTVIFLSLLTFPALWEKAPFYSLMCLCGPGVPEQNHSPVVEHMQVQSTEGGHSVPGDLSAALRQNRALNEA